jgi:hypothetical protein
VANTNSLGSFIKNKVLSVKQALGEITKKVDDNVARIKINEVVKQLDKVNPDKTVKDNQVMVLLLSYELLKEVTKQLGKSIL